MKSCLLCYSVCYVQRALTTVDIALVMVPAIATHVMLASVLLQQISVKVWHFDNFIITPDTFTHVHWLLLLSFLSDLCFTFSSVCFQSYRRIYYKFPLVYCVMQLYVTTTICLTEFRRLLDIFVRWDSAHCDFFVLMAPGISTLTYLLYLLSHFTRGVHALEFNRKSDFTCWFPVRRSQLVNGKHLITCCMQYFKSSRG